MSRSVRDKIWAGFREMVEPEYVIQRDMPRFVEGGLADRAPRPLPPLLGWGGPVLSTTPFDQTWGTKLQAANVVVMENNQNPAHDIFETLVLEDTEIDTFDPDVQDFLKGLI